MSLVNSGQLQMAKNECLSACNQNPKNAQLWFMLSAICGQMQDFQAAEKYCRKSIDINGLTAELCYNLAVAQRGQGEVSGALHSLHEAIKRQKNFTAALYEIGNIYLDRKDYAQALENYNRIIQTTREAFQAYTGIAIVQQLRGDHEASITACLDSLRINPVQPDVAIRLATLYDNQDNSATAIKYYKRAIELGYREADVYVNLGRMYASAGKTSDAKKSYQKALRVKPDSVEALCSLAVLYEEIHDTVNALDSIKRAVRLNPDDQIICFNYAKILASSYHYTEAEKLYKQVLSKNPGFIDATVNLGNLYLLRGRADDAQDVYAQACNAKKHNHDVCSNFLMSLNYTSRHSDENIFNQHIRWAKQIEKNSSYQRQLYTKKTGNSILKVGYVSPDFRDHSIAYFIEGILRFSDKNKVNNYCYSDVINSDKMTEKLKKHTDNWRDVSNLDDQMLADLIQHDGIDILIDLCGHTSGNRLPMFSLKPAPVQLTYLGYPNTTGLKAIDYRLVDHNTDPDGAKALMSESPLYIEPCFLCYSPCQNSPDISDLPVLTNNYVTFGSFNNLAKMSDEVVMCWSEILKQVTDSRLCIKARRFADSTIKKDYIKRFGKAGVDESRLDLLRYSDSITEHMNLYNNIDIALDTFPYNGTTTTFEALWMGVPVICLNGTRHAGRVGASILNTLDANDLLARNLQQYIKIACDLATNTGRLQLYREKLRSRLQISPLLDTETFTKKFESVLIEISNNNS